MNRERGEYLTGSRAEALSREIAAVEARMQERIDNLSRELADVRAREHDAIRAQVRALLDVLPNTREGG